MLTENVLQPRITRYFSMPSRYTFDIPPVYRFVRRWIDGLKDVADPFCGNSDIASLRNDISTSAGGAQHHFDAITFLRNLRDESFDAVLLDPPYSPRQIAESYAGMGGSWDGRHPAFIATVRDEAARIAKRGGIVLSFGWNSTGLGDKRGFEKLEVMLINHGGSHNDTICVAEKKC